MGKRRRNGRTINERKEIISDRQRNKGERMSIRQTRRGMQAKQDNTKWEDKEKEEKKRQE